MSAGERQEAQEKTDALQKKLQQQRKRTDQMREGFRDRKKNQLAKEMENAAQDLLDIASQQEGDASRRGEFGERAGRTAEGPRGDDEERREPRGTTSRSRHSSSPPKWRSRSDARSKTRRARWPAIRSRIFLGGLMGTKESTIALNQAATGLLKSKREHAGSEVLDRHVGSDGANAVARRAAAGPERRVDGDDAGGKAPKGSKAASSPATATRSREWRPNRKRFARGWERRWRRWGREAEAARRHGRRLERHEGRGAGSSRRPPGPRDGGTSSSES